MGRFDVVEPTWCQIVKGNQGSLVAKVLGPENRNKLVLPAHGETFRHYGLALINVIRHIKTSAFGVPRIYYKTPRSCRKLALENVKAILQLAGHEGLVAYFAQCSSLWEYATANKPNCWLNPNSTEQMAEELLQKVDPAVGQLIRELAQRQIEEAEIGRQQKMAAKQAKLIAAGSGQL